MKFKPVSLLVLISLILSLLPGSAQGSVSASVITPAPAASVRTASDNVISWTDGLWHYDIYLDGKPATVLSQQWNPVQNWLNADIKVGQVLKATLYATFNGAYPDDFIERKVDTNLTTATGSHINNFPFTTETGGITNPASATLNINMDSAVTWDANEGRLWVSLSFVGGPSAVDRYWVDYGKPTQREEKSEYSGYLNVILYLFKEAPIRFDEISHGQMLVGVGAIDSNPPPETTIEIKSQDFVFIPDKMSGLTQVDAIPSPGLIDTALSGTPTLLQGDVSATSELDKTPEVPRQTPFAQVTALRGKVFLTRNELVTALQVDDKLYVGDQVRLGGPDPEDGSMPMVAIQFCDGTLTRAERTYATEGTWVDLTIGQGGITSEPVSMWAEAKPFVRYVVVSGVTNYFMGYLKWGWIATKAASGAVKKFVVDPAINAIYQKSSPLAVLLSGSPLAPSQYAGGPGGGRLDLSFETDADGNLSIANHGSPVQISSDGEGVLVPGGAGLNLVSPVDLTTFPAPASLDIPVGDAVPITLTPPDGSILTTQTPTLTFNYPGALSSPLVPGSPAVRLNGVLVNAYLDPGELAITWQVPAFLQLHEGQNTVWADLDTTSGLHTTAAVTLTASQPPAAPKNFSAYPGDQSVILNWSPGFERDLAGYRLYRSSTEVDTGDLLTPALLSQPVFVDDQPLPGGSAWYRVSAVDMGGHESPLTSLGPVELFPAGTPDQAPSAPLALSATPRDRSVDISFTPTVEIAWTLERSEGESGPFTPLALLGTWGYTDKTVVPGHTYWYRLAALGTDQVASLPALVGPVMAVDLAPVPPQGLTAWNVAGSVTLMWDPSSETDLAGYNVYRRRPGGSVEKLNASLLLSPSFQDTIQVDQVYAWWVTAVDQAAHESAASSLVTLAGRRSDSRYPVMIQPSVGGYVQVDSGGVAGPPYLYGTQLTLQALPDPGYEFTGWGGDFSGLTNPLSFQVQGTIHISAAFTVQPVPGTLPATTLAGSDLGFAEGQGALARFWNPTGVAGGPGGVVFVADTFNNRIRRIEGDGTVSTYAGGNTCGFQDGPAVSALFCEPLGVVVNAQGVVFVADSGNHRIRRIGTDDQVTTLAGSGALGGQDGAGSVASFYFPSALALDAAGNFYVVDTNYPYIRKITSEGVVSTLPYFFNTPRGVAVRPDGSLLYIAEAGDNRIMQLANGASAATVLAGSGSAGQSDGPGSQASFNFPSGLTFDLSGALVVADQNNHRIRRISPTGRVTTLSGAVNGYQDSPPSLFSFPTGVALDSFGDVIVADRGNNRIRKIPLHVSALLTPSSPLDLDFPTGSGLISFHFPAGAVTNPTTVTCLLADAGSVSPPHILVGVPFELRLSSGKSSLVTLPSTPDTLSYTLEVSYSASELAGTRAGSLGLYTWVNNAWSPIPFSHTPGSTMVSSVLSAAGRFVLLADQPAVFLPFVQR